MTNVIGIRMVMSFVTLRTSAEPYGQKMESYVCIKHS